MLYPKYCIIAEHSAASSTHWVVTALSLLVHRYLAGQDCSVTMVTRYRRRVMVYVHGCKLPDVRHARILPCWLLQQAGTCRRVGGSENNLIIFDVLSLLMSLWFAVSCVMLRMYIALVIFINQSLIWDHAHTVEQFIAAL